MTCRRFCGVAGNLSRSLSLSRLKSHNGINSARVRPPMSPTAIGAPAEVDMKKRQFSAIKKPELQLDAERERGLINQLAAAHSSETTFHSQTEEQLRLLKTAIEQSNESVVIMTAR